MFYINCDLKLQLQSQSQALSSISLSGQEKALTDKYLMQPPWSHRMIYTSKISIFEHIHSRISESKTSNDHKTIDANPDLEIRVHSCGPLQQRSSWENRAIGYRPESGPIASLESFKSYISKTQSENGIKRDSGAKKSDIATEVVAVGVEYSSPSEAYQNALSELKENKSRVGCAPISINWLDLDIGETARSRKSTPQGSSSASESEFCVDDTQSLFSARDLSAVDRAVEALYHALPRPTLADGASIDTASTGGSMLLVVSQGDLVPLHKLIAKKQRFRWDPTTTRWGELEEGDLIAAAAHTLSGALFMKRT